MDVKQQRHIIDLLFVITLFCIFALSAIFLISIGAGIYGKTVDHMESNFNTRTALAYLTEKIRQSDNNASVSIGKLDDCEAIIITSQTETVNYYTYLYEQDGYLKELMTRQDIPLGPEAGQTILAVSSFSLEPVNEHLFNCRITIDKQPPYDLYINVRSGGIHYEE